MDEKQIESVSGNKDKQNTYRQLMGRYRKAISNEFYFEAMMIVYAALEDRFRSFLYYIGAIRNPADDGLNVSKTKRQLRIIYFGSEEFAKNKKLDINQISIKEKLIRCTIVWVISTEGKPEDKYLASLKEAYEGGIDIDGMLKTLDEIDAWRQYRNEVIHGLLNKNIDSLNCELAQKVEVGMRYVRYIDNQVKFLKRKDLIRKRNRLF